ncbi:MAG TPA: hypothetical protein VNB86_12560 [Gaiellaceae bacterium]|nr:hypothetical protein [Gaiellaceae bacterium]
MADVPDQLVLKVARDREGRRDVLFRRTAFTAILILLVLGLLNLFGQRPQTSTVDHPAATLELTAPSRVRGGLYYEARFRVDAIRELKKASLVLDSGWIEGTTINTIEPSPISEGSRDGDLVFELGHVPGGQEYVLYLQLQVNPTNVGRHSHDVQLYDGEELLASLDRTQTVFP